jgi:hypothetical protein
MRTRFESHKRDFRSLFSLLSKKTTLYTVLLTHIPFEIYSEKSKLTSMAARIPNGKFMKKLNNLL